MKKTILAGWLLFSAAALHAAAPQDIEIVELERTPEHSVHRVRIRTQEIPHIHAKHDAKALLESGGGTLYLRGVPTPMRPGDVVDIPRGVPHYFVNQSTSPYSQFRVTFTPPYDGQDRISVQVLKFKSATDQGQILSPGEKPPTATLDLAPSSK